MNSLVGNQQPRSKLQGGKDNCFRSKMKNFQQDREVVPVWGSLISDMEGAFVFGFSRRIMVFSDVCELMNSNRESALPCADRFDMYCRLVIISCVFVT